MVSERLHVRLHFAKMVEAANAFLGVLAGGLFEKLVPLFEKLEKILMLLAEIIHSRADVHVVSCCKVLPGAGAGRLAPGGC